MCLLVLVAAGCPRPSDPLPPPVQPNAAPSDSQGRDSASPLRLLVVDDSQLAATLASEWRTISDEPLEVSQLSSANVSDTPRLPPVDAVVYPVGLLGTLAEREQIVPLPDSVWNSERLDRRTLLEVPRKREAVWGEKTYAIPFGSPTPVLLYRADVFERLKLTPPASWQEFQQVAERLGAREELGELAPAASESWNGVLEPLAAGSAAPALLLRAAAYVRHRNQYSTLFDFITMEPLIESPPFVKALEELVAAHSMNPGPALEWDEDAVRRELLAGRAGMVVSYPRPEPRRSSEEPSEDSPAPATTSPTSATFAVALLPGSTSAYNASQKVWETRGEDDSPYVPVFGLSGRLGSVTKSSRRGQAAANLLTMLSTADWSARVLTASRGAGISRTSQLATPDRWVDAPLAGDAARQYAERIRETQRSPAWLMVPRIPGRDRYLAALDEAVRAAVRGEQTPAEALSAAAAQWKKITAELGRDSQKAAYRRCLGIDPS